MYETQQPVDWQGVVRSSDTLFFDNNWCAQEKLDGEKVIIESTNGDLTSYYRSGKLAKLSAKTRALMPVSGSFVIEGEQGNRVTGDTGFVAFDILKNGREDVCCLPYEERLPLLKALGVPVIQTVYGENAKRRLHVSVYGEGGEGLVFKRLDARYYRGSTVAQVKLKNWKSDTFRVMGVDGRGLELATMCGAPVGRSPGFALPGQLVEVQFREVTSGGKLRHPVLLRVRDDI